MKHTALRLYGEQKVVKLQTVDLDDTVGILIL